MSSGVEHHGAVPGNLEVDNIIASIATRDPSVSTRSMQNGSRLLAIFRVRHGCDELHGRNAARLISTSTAQSFTWGAGKPPDGVNRLKTERCERRVPTRTRTPDTR